jgi:hypothetical protein
MTLLTLLYRRGRKGLPKKEEMKTSEIISGSEKEINVIIYGSREL